MEWQHSIGPSGVPVEFDFILVRNIGHTFERLELQDDKQCDLFYVGLFMAIPSALLFHVLSAAMVSLDTLSSVGEGVGGSGKRE
jgi:hypothetical protein